MKGSYTRLLLAVLVLMVFGACHKYDESASQADGVMLTFTSEKPALGGETRTHWDGKTLLWSKGDQIAVAYTVGDVWQNSGSEVTLYKSAPLAADAEVAQFKVAAELVGLHDGAYVFYGISPAPESSYLADAPLASFTIPAVQVPHAASYDPSGDLMIGVLAEREVRRMRIMERDNLTEEEAERRISAQKPDNFYLENCDFIVYNNIKIDTNELMERIKNEKGN